MKLPLDARKDRAILPLSLSSICLSFAPDSPSSKQSAQSSSSEDACPPHDALKVLHAHPTAHSLPTIRLAYHILEHLLVDVLLQLAGHAPQHVQRDTVLARRPREQLEGALHLLDARVVAAAVQLERRDADEGLVGDDALVFGVGGVEEVAQLGGGGGRGTEGGEGAADRGGGHGGLFGGVGEEREGFLDLSFGRGGDVVLFGELGLPGFLLLFRGYGMGRGS